MESDHLNKGHAAGLLLALGACKASALLEKFSGWLMVGMAGVFSLLLTNMDRDNLLIGLREGIF